MPPQLPPPGRVPRTVAAVTFSIVAVVIVAVGPAVAAPDPGAGTSGYTSILDNLYTVVYNTLRYVGLIALGFGSIVWFVSGSSHRSAWGQRLFIGGIVMTVLYFGFSSVIAVLRWIATNGA